MKNYNLVLPQPSSAAPACSNTSETSCVNDEILWSSAAVWWGGIVTEFGNLINSVSTSSANDKSHDVFSFVAMVLLVPLTLPLWAPFVILKNLTTKCVVTRRSIELRSGILFKNQDTIRMQAVENIEVKGAIFGTGMVTFRAAGSEIFLRRVARCKQLQALIRNLTSQRL